jgi:phosphatidylglycerophosphate synthase
MSASGKMLVRATRTESAGAGLRVAGLSVCERNLKQLRSLNLDVVLATDGQCPLPAVLPAGVELRTLAGAQALDGLRAELHPAREVGADEVRPAANDFASAVRVTDPASCKRAEDAVFAHLLRGDLGMVARHLNKPLSFRFTRHVLCHLPLTPNQVSVVAALVGLLGATLIATVPAGQPWLMVAGFFLAHAQSVLDGCDGELARVRFQQSKLGEWLDTVIDEGLNIALFACTGVGLWRQTGSTLALGVGLATATIHLFYDVVALTELARQGQGGEMLKIRWWLAGGVNMKKRTGEKRGDLLVIVHGLGRRDFFVFAFLLYALAGVPFLALVHASIMAVGQLALTCSQVVWRLVGRPAG